MNTAMPSKPEFLLTHGDHLRALIRGLLFDEHEVEDVVQETWQRALESGPRETGAWGAWLSTVAGNLARNRVRTKVRRARREQAVARPESVTGPAELVEREELRKLVVDAVLALDEPYRAVVLRRYIDGQSPAQIARAQGVPAATVRTRLRRGLQQLRELLDAAHGGDRRAWSLAAIPLGLPGRAGVSFAGLGVLAGALAALLLGFFALSAWNQDPGSSESLEPELAAAPAQSAGGEAPAPAPEMGPGAVTIRTPSQEPGAGSAGTVSFAGKLVDRNGDPLERARVRILAIDSFELLQGGVSPEARRDWRLRAPSTGEALSDLHGRFRIDGLPPRALYFLKAEMQSYRLWQVVEASPQPGSTAALGELELRYRPEITGFVRGAGGAPVPGATVWGVDLPGFVFLAVPPPQLPLRGHVILTAPGDARVIPLPEWTTRLSGLLPIEVSTTDSEGKFRLRGAGRGSFVVHAQGYAPTVSSSKTIRLRPGVTIQGHVKDSTGQPVPGAELLAAPVGGYDSIALAPRIHRADERGAFRIPGMHQGKVVLAARRSPKHAWQVESARLSRARQLVTLPAERKLHLRVAAGMDLGSIEVDVLPGGATGELLHNGLLPALPHTIDWAGEQRSLELDQQPYRLRVRAKGHAETILDVGPKDSEALLDPPKELVREVLVRGPLGAPLAGARVWTQRPFAIERMSVLPRGTLVPRFRDVPLLHGRTDAEGRLLLRGLREEALQIRVQHPVYGGSSLSFEDLPREGSPIQFRFQGLGSVQGRITERGEAVEPGSWTVLLDDQGAKDRMGYDHAMPRWVRVGNEGVFHPQALPSSRFLVQALPGLSGVQSAGDLLDYLKKHRKDLMLFRFKRFDLGVGQEHEVTLEMRQDERIDPKEGTRVTGSVVVDGQPGADYEVVMRFGWLSRDIVRRTDASGRFDFGVVASGARTLAVREGEGLQLLSRKLELVKGERQDLQLQIQTAPVRMRVMLPDGRPARDARVWLREKYTHDLKPKWEADLAVDCDRNGRAVLPRVPVGKYYIHAFTDQGFAQQDADVVAGGGPELRFELERRYVLAGQLPVHQIGGGDALPTLHLREEGLGSLFIRRAEANGRFRFVCLPKGKYVLSFQRIVRAPGGGFETQREEIGKITLDRDVHNWEL